MSAGKQERSQAGDITPLAVGIDAAARISSIGRSTFYAKLASGEGPKTFMLGRRRLVRVETLNAWLAKLEKDASA